MPMGMKYSYGYNHKRKEVIFRFQIGSIPPIEIVMGVEALLQDLDFIRNDKTLAKFIESIREAKDFPIDHDFGSGKGDFKFDPKDWEEKMGDKS